MKIITKEEEKAHYRATLYGGFTGGTVGLVAGLAGVVFGHRRFPNFRALTLPLKAALVSSSATFGAIIAADRASRGFERARDPANAYQDKTSQQLAAARASETSFQRIKGWARENRYGIIGASWVASMAIALSIVGRSPYLTRAQKLVQARVYAQGLTVAVLVASAALEIGDANRGEGRWETVTVLDPDDPEHKHLIEKRVHKESYQGEDLWKDMVEAEERKMQQRAEKAAHRHEDSSKEHRDDHGEDHNHDHAAAEAEHKEKAHEHDRPHGQEHPHTQKQKQKPAKDSHHPAPTQGSGPAQASQNRAPPTVESKIAKTPVEAKK